jgi:hypothetical protein
MDGLLALANEGRLKEPSYFLLSMRSHLHTRRTRSAEFGAHSE